MTKTRTLIYRADGLLSDESVEEYSHDAERIEISEGRRKSSVTLDYGIDGQEKFKVPSNRLYEALHPVLAGVLNAADVTGPDETVKQTYQFSELTLVITSERVVKHVGAAVWDEDYEEFHFADVTALDVEEGSVSSQIIIESAGRPQRIKTPSDQTREVRERIERALLEYHGASSYEEFAREHADPDDHADAEGEASADSDPDADEEADPLAGGGVDPIDANPPELDENGAIVEEEASVTTADRPDDAESVSAAEASDAAAKAAAASASAPESTESAERAERADSESARSQTDQSGDSDEAALTADAADTTDTEDTADAADASGAATAANASAETTDSDGFADSGF
ncbi:DUF7115 domain-containing protein [Halorussus caseinilyticus]|uniref:DUF7115 domain-containing protein n=1 Tax=Halorussus caseinilyticus TaxID=3034025 RepID=A0ABD5WG21_9EURY